MLLDTHVVLWWSSADERLSTRARREIAKAETLYVSAASVWEIATLVRLGRIALPREVAQWIRDLAATERVSIEPLKPTVAADAGSLPNDFPRDPVDRFLYATARDLALPIITRDYAITDYAAKARDVRVVW